MTHTLIYLVFFINHSTQVSKLSIVWAPSKYTLKEKHYKDLRKNIIV